MKPICSCCSPAAEHTVTDERGRTWRFEQHRIFGPLILRADGEPAARQPGSRSRFWAAWEQWRKQQEASKCLS